MLRNKKTSRGTTLIALLAIVAALAAAAPGAFGGRWSGFLPEASWVDGV